jgi:hypothetical protein
MSWKVLASSTRSICPFNAVEKRTYISFHLSLSDCDPLLNLCSWVSELGGSSGTTTRTKVSCQNFSFHVIFNMFKLTDVGYLSIINRAYKLCFSLHSPPSIKVELKSSKSSWVLETTTKILRGYVLCRERFTMFWFHNGFTWSRYWFAVVSVLWFNFSTSVDEF